MPAKAFMRKAKSALTRKRGTDHQRFVFTLRPACLEGVPSRVKQTVLEWKGSGSKLCYTKVVGCSAGLAAFDDKLHMTTTLHQTSEGFEAKEYTLKCMEVQEIKSMGRVVDKTNCISQYTLDFSVFAKNCLEHGAEEEIEVSLQPKGPHGAAISLRAFVSATLLRNWSADLESTSSELSALTSSITADYDEYGYDDSQELPGLGVNSALSMLSDDSETMCAMPSPRPKSPQHVSSSASGAAAAMDPPAVARSRRTHTRTRSSDWGLATITETDGKAVQRTSSKDLASASPAAEVPAVPIEEAARAPSANAEHHSAPNSARGEGHFSLTHGLGFLGQLLRKQPSSLKDLTPEELRVEAARRETVDVNAEEDVTVLRERCEQLIYAREHLKAKNTELKQMLTEAQTRSMSDDAMVQELVQAKLSLADGEYKRLSLQLALQIEMNKSRALAAKLTAACVERDLMANQLANAT
eukprot:jgi/Ulvmu1/12851/UM098_0036.1